MTNGSIERAEAIVEQISYARGMLDLVLDNLCASAEQPETSVVESLFGIKRLLDGLVDEYHAWYEEASRR